MRTIKFRGKRSDTGEWAYGYYEYDSYGGSHLISVIETKPELKQYFVEVEPTTVGQYTGLLDKNGKEIYEGDMFGGVLGDFYVIWDEELCSFWATSHWHIKEKEKQHDVHWSEIVEMEDLEIISNIH